MSKSTPDELAIKKRILSEMLDDDDEEDEEEDEEEAEDEDYEEEGTQSDEEVEEDDEEEAEEGTDFIKDTEGFYEDGYDSELFGGEEDRAKLEAMPELQRESVLLERQEQRDKLIERKQAMRRWKAKQGNKSHPKSKAFDEQNDAQSSKRGNLRSRIQVKRGRAANALEDIRLRHEKLIKHRQVDVMGPSYGGVSRKEDIVAAKRRHGDDEDFRDEIYEEEVAELSEDDHRGPEKPKSYSGPLVDLATLTTIQIKRQKLVGIIEEPFCEGVVHRLVCRVQCGQDKRGARVYRIAEILELCETNSWAEYDAGSKHPPVRTNKALVVTLNGIDRTTVVLPRVSNERITADEFNIWQRLRTEKGVALMTREEAIDKRFEAERFRRDFQYTTEQVDEMVKRRGKLATDAFDAKRELMKERSKPEHDRDPNRIAELEKQLEISMQAEKVSEIELINQKHITEHIEAMERTESRARTAKRKNSTEARLDPFQRRPVRSAEQSFPTQDEEPDARPVNNLNAHLKKRSLSLDYSSLPNDASSELRHGETGFRPFGAEPCEIFNKLVAAHDFPLGIDIHAPHAPHRETEPFLSKKSTSHIAEWTNRNKFRQIMSLEDWRRVKGLRSND